MELYLDSVKYDEIEEAQALGYLTGLTTTPTFMYRDGVRDIDEAILKLAGMVNILQVEALGESADQIIKEAHRLIKLGLDVEKTVFKIPVSLEGTKACKQLTDEKLMVNIHLVYTLQQAYMAFNAGATYVCPLVGRLQDQGHDALTLVRDCVDVVNKYSYPSKVMFSSVRHMEHIKNALNIGVHACTIPWKVMKQLTENHFTKLGTDQFIEHTWLLTKKVREVVRSENYSLPGSATISDALVMMTKSRSGAVVILDENGKIHRIFTDGDLRRMLADQGDLVLSKPVGQLVKNSPKKIQVDANLMEAQTLFKESKVDTLVVEDNGKVVGLLDIQDII